MGIIGRCSSKLAQLITLPYFCGSYTRCSDRLYDFSLSIPTCHQDVFVNSFFPCAAKTLEISAIRMLLFSDDLNNFKCSINRHLLSLGSI